MTARVFAIIKSSRVVNLASGEFGASFGDNAVDVTDAPQRPSIGWRYDGESFAPPPAFSRDEALVKADAIARVNAAAGLSRGKYLTTSTGQETTYLLKSAELDAFDATIAPVDTDYPLLRAEALGTGMTMDAVADLVRTTRDQWIQLAAMIEGIRRGAIVAIENATTEADVAFAIPAPDAWP